MTVARRRTGSAITEPAPMAASTSYSYADQSASFIVWQPTPAVKEVVRRATKRDARGTLDDPRVQQAVIRCVSFERRHYAIRSHSNPAAEHDCKWLDDRWVCSCVAGSRGARCWHTTSIHYRYLRDAAEQTARLRRETEKAWPGIYREVAEYGDGWLSGEAS